MAVRHTIGKGLTKYAECSRGIEPNGKIVKMKVKLISEIM